MTQQPIRVFLLEDDEDLREALEDVLLNEGYEVLSAADGHEAVAKALDFSFDIFVFDVKLPGPDGLEVLAKIKGDPVTRQVPVVMLTSSREETDLVRSYDLGVNAFVVKPVAFEEFFAAIKEIGVFWALLNEPPPYRGGWPSNA